jgi:hypothetical protein
LGYFANNNPEDLQGYHNAINVPEDFIAQSRIPSNILFSINQIYLCHQKHLGID